VRSLEKEAAEEGTTVNADVNSIVSRHFNWDKKVEEFGFVVVPMLAFTRLIESVDDETIASTGREVVPSLFEEMAELWFQDSAPEKILDAVIMRFKFDTHIRARVTREGDAYTFIMHHDLGPKWSLFWENGARGIVERFFHVEPRTTRGESVVTASFKVNPKNLPT
jgi:hypothetical protein